MPLYEFRCPACDHVFEELRRAGDDGDAPCPDCGHASPRVVSLSAFALKGTGFYANDYGNRRPGSFQKDGKGTIKGTVVPVPELARDPSKPLPDAADPDDQASDDAKEGA
ncbi:MAG: FmdB family zinc ribbon protein [Desulfovibrionaceae bacterium]